MPESLWESLFMQVVCPQCGARYEVPAGNWPVIDDGDGASRLMPRRARCHGCGHVWEAEPVQAPSAVAMAAVGEEFHDGEFADEAEPARRRWPWLMASIAVLLMVAALALAPSWRFLPQEWQQGLAQMGVPPPPLVELALPAITLPRVNLPRISLPQVTLPRIAPPPLSVSLAPADVQHTTGNRVWEISGTLRNDTRNTQKVPAIEVALVDGDGRALGEMLVQPAQDALAAGESIKFTTSIVNPPAGAVRLRARLKPAEIGRLR